MKTLSKTDFIQYLNCPKFLWLRHSKPSMYPHGEFSDYAKKLAAEGYLVEDYVKQLINEGGNSESYSFQREFETDDDSIDLFEIKSSTSVKDSNPHNQLKDAAFQVITAKRNGERVRNIFIVH